MRGSQKSTLAAIGVFSMIAVVAIGGMTWATQSSFALAKKTITGNYDSLISEALWRMDSYINGILYSETRRDYVDYNATKTVKPLKSWSDRGYEIDADLAEIPTQIAIKSAPNEWIDLYFQINANRQINSPQIDDESSMWALAGHRIESNWPRAMVTWPWLKVRFHELDIRTCVARTFQSNRSPFADISIINNNLANPATTSTISGDAVANQKSHDDFEHRKKTLHDSQRKHLPPAACEEPVIAVLDEGDTSTPVPINRGFNTATQQQGEEGVTITIDPIVTFWLGDGPDDHLKLAFVRECHADADVFYQGFVGDWSILQPELLSVISDLQLDAELLPANTESNNEPTPGKFLMSNLPVRLNVPGIPGGAYLAAWRETKGTLITMWVATAAVLIVAGWGLRNLVLLTERRMQFAYAVTHELRTPLTTFRLYSDMLSANLVPEASKQEYLDTLNRESARLSNLVEGVLEYARLENHRVRLNPVDIDAPTLLNTISETLKKRCEAYGVKPQTENLITNGLALYTDVDVVQRIAGVLVNNACRHARDAEDAKVLVRISAQDDQVYLDVIDTGQGIERRDIRNIFKPFRRGRRADTTAQGGIGLGLALAKNWANLLGGKLELASRQHPQYGGAHFRMTIPARLKDST